MLCLELSCNTIRGISKNNLLSNTSFQIREERNSFRNVHMTLTSLGIDAKQTDIPISDADLFSE